MSCNSALRRRLRTRNCLKRSESSTTRIL